MTTTDIGASEQLVAPSCEVCPEGQGLHVDMSSEANLPGMHNSQAIVPAMPATMPIAHFCTGGQLNVPSVSAQGAALAAPSREGRIGVLPLQADLALVVALPSREAAARAGDTLLFLRV